MNKLSQDQSIDSSILSMYSIEQKLGSGAYGHVWKVINKKDKKFYALKKVYSAFQNSLDAERTYREISILKKINHKNVVKLKNIHKAQNNLDLYLVFQLVESDLFKAIKGNILKEDHKKFIIYQIAKALKYIHTAKVIHRDIKPSNILINTECKIKLCDFGLSRTLPSHKELSQSHNNEQSLFHENQEVVTQFIATRWYRAPQVMLGSKQYTQKADIWSFACLIYQMYAYKSLLPGKDNVDQIQKMLEFKGFPNEQQKKSLKVKNIDRILGHFSVQKKPTGEYFKKIEDLKLRRLLMRMFEYDPAERPSAEQILDDEFLQQLRDFEQEKQSQCKIRLEQNQNIKLTVNEYRELIYSNFITQAQEINYNKKSYHMEKEQSINQCNNECPQGITRGEQTTNQQQKQTLPSYLFTQEVVLEEHINQDQGAKNNTSGKEQVMERKTQSVSLYAIKNKQQTKHSSFKRKHQRQQSLQPQIISNQNTKIIQNSKLIKKQSSSKFKKRSIKFNSIHNQIQQNQFHTIQNKKNHKLPSHQIQKENIIPQNQSLSIFVNKQNKVKIKQFSKSLNVSPKKSSQIDNRKYSQIDIRKSMQCSKTMFKDNKRSFDSKINQTIIISKDNSVKLKQGGKNTLSLHQSYFQQKKQNKLPKIVVNQNRQKMVTDHRIKKQRFNKGSNSSVHLLKEINNLSNQSLKMTKQQVNESNSIIRVEVFRKVGKKGINYLHPQKYDNKSLLKQ